MPFGKPGLKPLRVRYRRTHSGSLLWIITATSVSTSAHSNVKTPQRVDIETVESVKDTTTSRCSQIRDEVTRICHSSQPKGLATFETKFKGQGMCSGPAEDALGLDPAEESRVSSEGQPY
ncbi:hypothetical protein BJ508DRAFT_378172 [Ascobolus immersus RN42]|uniref:Uncharacterized protein n=1 Tax=Ascobolus immersus RN42 TaxID=1160509 RepID=A0A3N4HZY6_ASCIM|nr:hypothetical protein BJ508DRAFT_378172 [Ascobolus immersus RN42]